MKSHEFITEALKPSQYRSLVKGRDKVRYADIFDNKYRIYLPIVQSKVKPNPKIEQAIRDLGYEIEDYKTGIAHKADNPAKRIKIGKLLKDSVLFNLFANDPVRAASKSEQLVVISRHPYDIAGMSTDRGWTSCMNLDGSAEKKYVPLDIKVGTVIAYLINSDDKNIEHPIARLLIKPFVNKETKDIAFGVENKMYGSGSTDFRNVVMSWVDQINSRKELNGVFKLKPKLYQDSATQITLDKGIRNTIPEKTVKRDGTQEWRLDGAYHRVDGPAVIYPSGSQAWFLYNQLHRDNGPAIIRQDGSKEWFQHGKLHRTDGPANISSDGEEYWFQLDKLHRIDGPAIRRPDGYQAWYQHDELHRVDGPAVIYPSGREEYWKNGKRIK